MQDYRITKLREYLMSIIESLTKKKLPINAYMLSNKVENYSLDRIPTDTTANKWIVGTKVHRDVYSFRSRMNYSQDTINNLKNVGFFEDFERLINSNNENGILPDIPNIESIECLDCGTLNYADTNTAEFDIQIQIKYRDYEEREVSL